MVTMADSFAPSRTACLLACRKPVMALGSPHVRVGLLHRHRLRPGLLREARQHVVAVQEARELQKLALEIREPAVFFGRGQPLAGNVSATESFFLEYAHGVSLY